MTNDINYFDLCGSRYKSIKLIRASAKIVQKPMLLKEKQLSSSFQLQFTHTPHSKHQPRRVNGVHEIWTNPSSHRPTEKMSPKLKLIYSSFPLRLHNLHSNKRTRKTNKSHFLFFLFNEPFITDGEADIQVSNQSIFMCIKFIRVCRRDCKGRIGCWIQFLFYELMVF